MKGRLYDPAVGRFLSPDILVQELEIGLSYNRYSYCLNNPLKYVDPSGWSFTNPTNYVDEFGNTLLNTDDGSQDRIVVPEEMQSNFAKFGEMHEDPGMKGMFDNPHWNKHMKSEIFGVSSFALDMSLGLYHSQEARQAAIDYMQNPSSANGYNMVWQETKAQYMNPELLVGLASLTLNAGNIASAVRRIGTAKSSIQLTKARFGHAFATHGDDATKFLMNRAKGSGMAQGQFLNNQKAAQFILDNVHKTANGAVNMAIPKGFPARVIMPNGTFKAATHIRLVPGGGGVKTAYPLIPGL